MIPPRRHADEARRVAALARLRLLDTAREERYDRLARLATSIIGTPIGLISLVDEDRQWFKSAIGIDATETPRDVAFCAHALNEEDLFVVEDATTDERFHDNPFVLGDPNVRFYAGAVIREPGGLPMGTICAIDDQPRRLTAMQRQALIDLAALVEEEFARTSDAEALDQLAQSARGREMVFDSLNEGLIVQDTEGRIVDSNPAAERMLGMSDSDLAGREAGDWSPIREDGSVFLPDEHPAAVARRTLAPVTDQVMGVPRPDGASVWLRVNARPIFDEGGALQGVLATFADITESLRSRKILNATLDTAPVGLATLDGDRRVTRCNERFAAQYGRPVEALVGMSVRELVGSDLDAGDPRDDFVTRPDGTQVCLTNQLAVLDDALGAIAVWSSHDVTDKQTLLEQLTQYGHLFKHANDIITVVGRDGQVVYASPSNERVLGYPDGYRHPGGVLGLVHPEDAATAAVELAGLVNGTRGEEPFAVRIRNFHDEWRHMECVGVNLLDEPAVSGVVITARDITERVRLAEELEHRAAHDQLTDLPNRRLLDQRLSEALSRGRRDRRNVGLCFIDLDGFKGVNDTLGHQAGDQLLVDVAECIKDVVRGGDTPARLGGDEFVVVLDPVGNVNDALIVARRLRDAIVALGDRLPPQLQFGASLGVAVSEPEDSPDNLVQRADAALYRAKERGGSAIEVSAEGALAR